MSEKPEPGLSRRQFIKIGGIAGAAAQVGGIAGAALQAGRDKGSYTGWESFEGTTQSVDRDALAIRGPAYEKSGATRRPSRQTEYVFGRAGLFRRAMRSGWQPADGAEALDEPLRSYYAAHPDVLAKDVARETEIGPRGREHHAKYDGYFRLANAWSAGWADTFSRYPPRPQGPPEEADFKGVAREKLVPRSPELAARLIKTVAHHYGATLVGITALNPDWCYAENVRGGQRGEFAVPAHWKLAIALGVPHEWDQMLSNPAHGTSYDAYARAAIAAGRLAAFVKALGYPARPHTPPTNYDLIVPPILVDAGLGQQGRHGFVITPETGANFRAAVVTTDFPMACDKPIDFGVEEFCKTCKICAEQCPSGSISHADSNAGMYTRGYRHWEIDQTSCFNYWQAAMGPTGCRLCIATCPYSRKSNWVHEAARELSGADPTGVADEVMTWMQKALFPAPGAQAYLPPPDGRFAGYRPAPEWLEVEEWFDVEVNNPQLGG